MEVPPPKVHRHHRHRRSNRRNNEQSSSTERQSSQNQNDASSQYPVSPLARVHERNQQLQQQQQHGNNSNSSISLPSHNIQIVASFHPQHNTTTSTAPSSSSATQQQQQENPAVLVNGHEPNLDEINNDDIVINNQDNNSSLNNGQQPGHVILVSNVQQQNNDSGGGIVSGNSGITGGGNVNNTSNNSIIRNQSEILSTIRNQQNQLDTNNINNIRRTMQLTPHGSPRPGSSASTGNIEQNQQQQQQQQHNQTSLHHNVHKDPQASPAQRSTRSRSSLEKSPRRKRSKSESRRRRERKLIAAGEMEVRQANETLMRYLKQVSEMNDASLSGELEIDHNFDERRVHRKTKSQRDKRGHLISKSSVNKLYAAGGGLSSILKDLSEDIVPGNEIYNPFTPVVSPTEGPPSRIDKMFIQTSSGYRPVDYYKHQIDPESNKHEINTSVNLSCALQRIWIMVSNICHGLLGGLALAHLLFIITNRPLDWVDGAIKHYSAFAEVYANTFFCLAIICMVSIFDRMDLCHIDITNASELISFRWIIIAMIYIATIILTLCAETIDEKLYLTNFNITIFEEEMENNQVLNVWNSLSIARSIGAIFGWVMIGLSPGEDLLYENLLEMEKYQLTNN
ncbi:myb-like protein D isoform X2 [Condylostylus longicornis]|uniref:myb-like protein D isoform X2 n=1 Tax=Condylostylus longicornis TaxID=2530218 RepID=UPI00244E047D|nr:myb-like protein D isoform X2 [Condylostylus longicornis]